MSALDGVGAFDAERRMLFTPAALVRRVEMAVGFKWFQEKYISQVRSVRPLRSECNAELKIAELPKPMRANATATA